MRFMDGIFQWNTVIVVLLFLLIFYSSTFGLIMHKSIRISWGLTCIPWDSNKGLTPHWVLISVFQSIFQIVEIYILCLRCVMSFSQQHNRGDGNSDRQFSVRKLQVKLVVPPPFWTNIEYVQPTVRMDTFQVYLA